MKYLRFVAILFALIIGSNISYGQGISWLSALSGSGYYYNGIQTNGMTVASNGDVYVTGQFYNGASLGSATLTGTAYEMFLAKLTPQGQLIWVKTGGGIGNDVGLDVAVDDSGGVYVCGYFNQTATFDTLTVTAAPISYSNISEHFLAKYDTLGNLVWFKKGAKAQYSNYNYNYIGKSKVEYKNGSIYYLASTRLQSFESVLSRTFDGFVLPVVAGSYSNSYSGGLFVLKTSPSGVNDWLTPANATDGGGGFLNAVDLEINSLGNVLVQAWSRNTFTLGSLTLGAYGTSYDMNIIQLSDSGTYISDYYLNNIGYYNYGASSSISVDSDDNVYALATNSVNYINTIIAGDTIPYTSDFLIRFNDSLVPFSAQPLTSNNYYNNNYTHLNAMEINNSGEVLLGGSLSGVMTLGSTSFILNNESFFVKCDTAFNSITWRTNSESNYLNYSYNYYYQNVLDCSFGQPGEAFFCGGTGVSTTTFGDYSTGSSNSRSGFTIKVVDCAPIQNFVDTTNTVICGGGSVTLNATYNQNLTSNWLSAGTKIPGAVNNIYVANNPGAYSMLVDSLGCKDTSNVVNVVLDPLPTVTVPTSTLTICATSAPFFITGGSPSGGVWTGNGVVNDTLFNPAIVGVGPSLLTYTYTTPEGCSNSAVRIANVVTPPSLLVSGAIPTFCENDGSYALGSLVFPGGGDYSGTGVSASQFDPVAAGPGTHVIKYGYSVGVGCSDTVSFNITVNPQPTITFPAFAPLCETVFALPLNSASPAGGTYSGAFTISNTFYPFLSGHGNYNVAYTVTQNGCSKTETQVMQVDPIPVAVLPAMNPFCVNDTAITLQTGSPSGGNYLINDTLRTTLNPSSIGAGTHSLKYIYTNACGSDTAEISFLINALPVVSINNVGPYCENDTTETLYHGQPSGGIYSGVGIASGVFHPALAVIGANTAKYTFTDTNGCTTSDSTIATVYAMPIADITSDSMLCINTGIINLVGTPTGGSFTGTGVSGNTFNPATAGIGSHVISYVVSNVNNCYDTTSQTIVVADLPTVSLGAFPVLCEGSSPLTLTGGNPISGVYSGAGVSSGVFTPSVAGTGVHTINYLYTDVNGCAVSATSTIEVDTSTLSVSFDPPSSACLNGGNVVLTGGLPTGGVYSGLGVSAGQFDPQVTGVGTSPLAYSYTTQFGCVALRNQTITVDSIPQVSISALSDICINATPITLTQGFPVGGTYSGSGVSGITFTPANVSAGTNNIMYTYTDGNGCVNADTQNILVNNIPVVTIPTQTDACLNSGVVVISGASPIGGTYSGIGVTDTIFNPLTVGIGTHPIQYTFTDTNGCVNSSVDSIQVNTVTANLPAFTSVCADVAAFNLTTGNPSGGVYSGTGVVAGQFDPSVSGPGNFNIIYQNTYLGCVASDTQQITVNQLPLVTNNNFTTLCESDTAFLLSGGIPFGGVYAGASISTNLFNASIAGSGTHIITYTYTDINGCINNAIDSIIVFGLPAVTIGTFSNLCADDTAITLTGGTPLGGSYSGSGISNGMFDPSTVSSGTHEITYTYSDAHFCVSTASDSITVNPLPVVTLAQISDLCIDANPITLAGGLPVGGVFTGTSVSAGTFDPSLSGVGAFDIAYEFIETTGCSASDTQQIVVNPLPIVNLPILASICENDTAILLAGATPIGGTYSGTGVINGYFDPTISGVGSFLITYMFTDTNGCDNLDTNTIVVHPKPIIGLPAFADLCEASTSLVLSGGTPIGGTYSGIGVSSGSFDPIVAGVGNHFISYTYTDANGCTNFDSNSISIHALPVVSLDTISSVCEGSNSFTLIGGLPLAGIYSGQGVVAGDFDPTVSGVGSFDVTYMYTDTNGCVSSDTQQVVVTPTPIMSLPLFSDLCIDNAVVQLSGGTPLNGTYSGTGVLNGDFDAAVAGVGSHIIQYTFTDTFGCTNDTAQSIQVNGLPIVSYVSTDSICEGSSPFVLSGASPTGGVYNSSHVTNNSFDPVSSGVGYHDVIYTFTDTLGCVNTDTSTIVVHNIPVISIVGNDVICEGDSTILTVSGAQSYAWNNGQGQKEITVAPISSNLFAVIGTDSNGCVASDSVLITVNENPTHLYPSTDTVCSDSMLVLDAGAGYSSYLWENQATTQYIEVGPYAIDQTDSIRIQLTDTNGCFASFTRNIISVECKEDRGTEVTVKVFPNPSNGHFYLEVVNWPTSSLQVLMVSATGALIMEETLLLPDNTLDHEFDLRTLADGLYVLIVRGPNDELIYREPIVISR